MSTNYYGSFDPDDRRAKSDKEHHRRVREAEEAQAAHAEKIRQNKIDNERRVAEQRDPAIVKAHQETIDNYDPDQLRADVVATYRAVIAAVTDGNLPGAIADHLAAVLREPVERSKADQAIANGAQPRPEIMAEVHPSEAAAYPDGRLKGSEEWRDHSGKAIRAVAGDALVEYAQRLHSAAIVETARGRADE